MCHPERSEGSHPTIAQILRVAQDDKGDFWFLGFTRFDKENFRSTHSFLHSSSTYNRRHYAP